MCVIGIVKRSVGGSLAMMLGVILTCMPAQSAPMFYDFDVAFDSGSLSGRSFMGSFSVEGDQLAGVGFEVFGPRLPKELLSFDLKIDRSSFQMIDHPLFSFLQARVAFVDGDVTWIRFFDVARDSFISINLFSGATGANKVVYGDDDGLSKGSVTDVTPAEDPAATPAPQVPAPAAVPPVPAPTQVVQVSAPATAALLASGLIAMGWMGWMGAMSRRRLRA